MTVSGIGSVSQALAGTSVDQTSWQARMQATLGPVAQLFDMTTDQLQQALQSGQSLSDIASSKGVSQTDLLGAIKQGVQAAQPAGSAPLSDSQLTNIANRVANHHHHHHGGGGGATSSTSSTATSTNPLDAVQQDIQQLLQDLGTALSANGSAGSTGTATDPNASLADILTQTNTVDQQL